MTLLAGLLIGIAAASAGLRPPPGAASTPAEALPAVITIDLGPFTLHVASRPFRLSLHHGGKLLLAERPRRRSASLEVLGAPGWSALMDVRRLDRREGAVVIEAAMEGAERTAKVEVESTAGEGGALARFLLEDAAAEAIRDDWIPAPGELFFFGRGTPRLVLSSRQYAILIEGREGRAVRAFLPDPDALRIEADGTLLRWTITPGAPRDVLRVRARLFTGPAPPAGVSAVQRVKSWDDLRSAVLRTLEESLGGRALPPSIAIAGGAADAELARRASAAAAFLGARLEPAGPETTPKDVREAAERLARARQALSPLFEQDDSVRKAEGIGLVRPLLVEHPEDLDAWKVTDAWLLGQNILVAPILERGKTRRRVHLPPGTWLEAGPGPRGARFQGPADPEVDVSLGAIAVFVREEAAGKHAELMRAVEELGRP